MTRDEPAEASYFLPSLLIPYLHSCNGTAGCWSGNAWVILRRADGATCGSKEPAVSNNSMSRRGLIHLGFDVSKDSIAVGVLHPGEESVEVGEDLP